MDAVKVQSSPSLQAAQAAKKVEPVRNSPEARAQTPEMQAEKAARENPRPNVNGQGQVIGTRLSVTA